MYIPSQAPGSAVSSRASCAQTILKGQRLADVQRDRPRPRRRDGRTAATVRLGVSLFLGGRAYRDPGRSEHRLTALRRPSTTSSERMSRLREWEVGSQSLDVPGARRDPLPVAGTARTRRRPRHRCEPRRSRFAPRRAARLRVRSSACASEPPARARRAARQPRTGLPDPAAQPRGGHAVRARVVQRDRLGGARALSAGARQAAQDGAPERRAQALGQEHASRCAPARRARGRDSRMRRARWPSSCASTPSSAR